MRPGLNVTKDNVPALLAAVRALSRERVMVGVPDVNAGTGRGAGGPNNAELAYIHEHGAPEANIPARPFLGPGIKRVQDKITGWLRRAGVAALSGDQALVTRCLHSSGLTAASSAQTVITAGIPPPLAASTVAARIARRGSKSWRAARRAEVAANVAAGRAPGEGLFTPLIDTGALWAAITYVVRRVR